MIPERMHRLLTQTKIGYLCTADSGNQPHITPIFIIYDPKNHKMYFQTSRGTKKVRDILVNPKVSLTVDSRDPVNPFNNEGVLVQGDAEILETELEKAVSGEDGVTGDLGAVLDTLKSKFVEVLVKGKPAEKVVVRINTHKMVYWRGPKFHTVNI